MGAMMYDPRYNLIKGIMSDVELNWINGTSACFTSYLEVGTYKGRSAHAAAVNSHVKVYCVDHFKGSIGEENSFLEYKEENGYHTCMRNLWDFRNVTVIPEQSTIAAELFLPKEVDMIFIDGSHDYDSVKRDILSWLPKCKHLLCGHDYGQASIQCIAEELRLPMKQTDAGSIWEMRIQ
jgi:hypothetical protein